MKKILCLALVLLLTGCGTINQSAAIKNDKEVINDTIKFEYGLPIIFDYQTYLNVDNNDLTIESNHLNKIFSFNDEYLLEPIGHEFIQVGEYDFILENEEKILNLNLEVVDETAPKFTKAPTTINLALGEDFIIEEHFSAFDLNGASLGYEGVVDENVAGQYPINVKVFDRYNNATAFQTLVNVIDNSFTNHNLVLVNKEHFLPEAFVPTLASIGSNHFLQTEAALAYKELSNAINSAGFNHVIISSYRSKAYQKGLYDNYVAKHGQAFADKYSAKPRTSEHELGLAIDLGLRYDFSDANQPLYDWLANNAYHFGFVLRYPKGKEHLTGYAFEPWHYRYVGMSHARKMYDENLILEEYLAKYY